MLVAELGKSAQSILWIFSKLVAALCRLVFTGMFRHATTVSSSPVGRDGSCEGEGTLIFILMRLSEAEMPRRRTRPLPRRISQDHRRHPVAHVGPRVGKLEM